MSEKRRPCAKCGRNRAERFYVSARGRVCSTCRKGRTRGATRDMRLQETYGITQAEYEALFAQQGGKCGICSGKRRGNLDVDHCHKQAKAGLPIRHTVRGLLCRRCNRRLLPAAMDNELILLAAVEWLRKPPAHRLLRG